MKAEAKRKKERQEEWERYERREDQRKIPEALNDSQQQLSEIIESWGKAMIVERFISDVEDRLAKAAGEQRQFLEERVKIARQIIGSIDPLEFLKNWRAPGDRYQSKYDDWPRSPVSDRSEEQ